MSAASFSLVRMAGGDCAEPTPELSNGPDKEVPKDAAEKESHVDVNDPIYQVQHT